MIKLIRHRAHLVFPEEEVLVARADDRDDVLPAAWRSRAMGIHGGDADAARHADDRAEVLDLGRVTERSGDRVEASPTFMSPISIVDLPTSWKMRVIVPAARRGRRW
jgi:hypothetical protein